MPVRDIPVGTRRKPRQPALAAFSALATLIFFDLSIIAAAADGPAGAAPAVATAAAAAAAAAAADAAGSASSRPWLDPSKPVAERVAALVSRMNSYQKLHQLYSTTADAIPALGVPAFDWKVECAHGLVNEGKVDAKYAGTMYPAPIMWAATFDDDLAHKAASELGDEARAYNNYEVRRGRPPKVSHCFAPHVAIVRDARWGRISETYGEDPRLAGNMAFAYVTGVQGGPGGNSTYIKTGATCKHFIGADVEGCPLLKGTVKRFDFNAVINSRDMRQSYLPPFEACVKANVESIMCAYSAVNGLPSCQSKPLLQDILRDALGFKGFVSSDCGAFDFLPTNKYGSLRQQSARGMAAGTDLSCWKYDKLNLADVSAKRLNSAVTKVLETRVKLGHFDPPTAQPWGHLQPSIIGSAGHLATARRLVAEGAVLLKNQKGLLPLRPASLRKVAVMGPFANNPEYLMGNYYLFPTARRVVTPLAALRGALKDAQVLHNPSAASGFTTQNVQADVRICQAADVCVLFLGSRMHKYARHSHNAPESAYDPISEGEEHDRLSLRLVRTQEKLWQTLARSTTKPLVVVLVHGGPLDVSDMVESPRVGAILATGHPGEGAAGLADVLLGKVSPSGRLPVTWYRESYTKLKSTDMRMRASGSYPGRTHRYWRGPSPLFQFGYGLSYTTFQLTSPTVTASGSGSATASITVRNTGKMTADTAVLLFMRYLGPADSAGTSSARLAVIAGSRCDREATTTDMVQTLVGYQRVGGLKPGRSKSLTFRLVTGSGSSSTWSGFGERLPPCGVYGLQFGQDQPKDVARIMLE